MKKIYKLVLYLLLVPVNVFAAPSVDQVSFERFNQTFQDVFNKVHPIYEAKLAADVDAKLNGHKLLVNGDLLRIEMVSWDPLNLGFNTAPGVIVNPDQTLTLDMPLRTTWSVRLDNVALKSTTYAYVPDPSWRDPFRTKKIAVGSHTDYVSVSVTNIKASQSLRITGFDDGKIDVDNVSEPSATFDINIVTMSGLAPNIPGLGRALEDVVGLTFSTSMVDALLKATKLTCTHEKAVGVLTVNPIQYALNDAICDAISGSSNKPASLVNAAADTLLPVGDPITYPVTPAIPDMEQIISNIDDKIIDVNMPDGIVYEVFSDKPAFTSWIDGYGKTANWRQTFDPDPTVSVGKHGTSLTTYDSAKWTGYFLAAMAYRYNALHDQKSLSYVKKALGGIEKLFEANGNSGLLARFAAPSTSVLYNQIMNDVRYKDFDPITQKKTFIHVDDQGNSVDWISHQGLDGISRDQYTGVMLGLRAAYDLVDDNGTKARIEFLVGKILDYLISINWVLTEDRDLTNGGTPTPFASVPYMRVTFLTIGNHITGLYAAELDDAYTLLDMAWLSSAGSALAPIDAYYKWDLFYANILSYFAIEKDPIRRAKMMNGAKIADYYIGHHTNPWFDLVRASYMNSGAAKDKLLQQAWEVLKLRMQSGHRHYLPGDINGTVGVKRFLNNIEMKSYKFPMESDARVMPRYPIHPALREFGEFVWQRSPYNVVDPNSPGSETKSEIPTLEQIGGDLSLVYWMLRAEKSYCSSRANNTSYEYINSVQIGNQTQISGNNKGYLDATQIPKKLGYGNNVITLTPGFSYGTYPENWKLWIDYNNDTVFDANEMVFSDTSSAAINGAINVPNTVNAGATRMRVSMVWSQQPNPCGTFTYGEVEDYTVDIQ